MSVIAATLARLDAATDGQLLGRFVQSRDADAFAALVRRLGPTVLAVCRRACPDSHLAEDAFQAAFLVLAKKADTVRPREQVAVWLHGVAYRTASKARVMLSARRRREVASPTLPNPPAADSGVPDDDELRKLDAAVAALPEHLRAAVVLCELEGRSRKDAAKQLGIPEGTLSSRLADARKRLGARLRPTTTAVVTAALAASTAEAAVGGSTSETVNTLARGVMSMLLLNKLKLPAAALAVVTLTVLGLSALSPTVVTAAPVPKEKPREGLIGVVKDGDVLLLKADGEIVTRISPKDKDTWPPHTTAHPAPTATGFPVALLAPTEGILTIKGRPSYTGCGVWLLSGPDDPTGKRVDVGEHKLQGQVMWSRDGKRLFIHCFPPTADMVANVAKYGTCGVGKYLVFDPATGKTTDALIPAGHTLIGETPDGNLLTNGWWPEATKNGGRIPLRTFDAPLFLVSADGKTVEQMKHKLPQATEALDLSPDGHTLLGRRHELRLESDTLQTMDLRTGEKTRLEPANLKGKKVHIAYAGSWSPDGKRIVFGYGEEGPMGRTLGGGKLVVCDADGQNCKELLSADGSWALEGSWR